MGNSRHLGSSTLNVIMEMFTKMNNFREEIIVEIIVETIAERKENKSKG